MNWLKQLVRELKALFRPENADVSLSNELEVHLEMQIQANIAAGMNPKAARYKALRGFGGVDQTKEQCRELRPLKFIRTVFQDVRYGGRTLVRNLGFTLMTVLTLAFGIGATASIFTVVNSILLAPLPYRDSSRLVSIYTSNPRYQDFHMANSLSDALGIEEQSKVIEASGYYSWANANLSGADQPVRVQGFQISMNLFDLLGAKPSLGRFFDPSEYTPGNGNFAVLSHRFWKSRFAGRADIIGRTVALDGKPYTIVGVAAADFEFPTDFRNPIRSMVQVWMPIQPRAEGPLNPHYANGRPVGMLARLRPGATIEQLNSELQTITARQRKGAAAYDVDWSLRAANLHSEIVGEIRPTLLILFGAVGIVLLIACVNIANLLLARAWQRQREIALRIVLGASSKRITRQLLTESLILASSGGAAGCLMAIYMIRAIRRLAPQTFLGINELHPDWTFVLFSLSLVGITAVLFGLAPALQASHVNPQAAIKGGWTEVPVVRKRWMRRLLVAFEIALVLPLVIGSSLLVKSLFNMTRTPTGIRTDHLISIVLPIPAAKYADKVWIEDFLSRMLSNIREVPGVEVAAVSDVGIWSQDRGAAGHVWVEGNPETSRGVGNIVQFAVTPDYFKTTGIRILKGREFLERDRPGAPLVSIVNQKMAQMLWGKRDPIDTRLSFQYDQQGKPIWVNVVGVAANTREFRLDKGEEAGFYTPYYQRSFPGTYVLVRTATDPAPMIGALKRQIWSLDPELPVGGIMTADEAIRHSLVEPVFRAAVLSAFAALGLLLGMIGVYGVVSYTAVQRTKEIGIRAAIGATPRQIIKLIVREALSVALAGVLIGLCTSLALTKLLRSLLYGVTATDTSTFILAALLLLAVAVLASYLPARRASKVDPILALRTE